jgi:hypothetical protein
MAKFLTRAELFRLLQRELPENVYPDGAPEAFLSTASIDAKAKTLADAYAAIAQLYGNFFPQTASEQIDEWEVKVFGYKTTESLTEPERINRILARLRAQPDLSRWSILLQVANIIPGVIVDLVEPAQLDQNVGQDLKGDLSDLVWGPDWTAGDPAPSGVTVTDILRNDQAELYALRNRVFKYTLLVYSDTLSAAIKASIEETLTIAEPARSAHSVVYMPESAAAIAAEIPNVDRDSGSYAIRVDPDDTVGIVLNWFGFEGDPQALGFGNINDASQGGVWFFLYPGV